MKKKLVSIMLVAATGAVRRAGRADCPCRAGDGGGFVGGKKTAGEKRIIARRTRRECFVLLCVILLDARRAELFPCV